MNEEVKVVYSSSSAEKKKKKKMAERMMMRRTKHIMGEHRGLAASTVLALIKQKKMETNRYRGGALM